MTELHLNDNRLTSLSLSGLPKLMRLNVYANKLTAIDLTELPFLMWLFVFDNELSELDLSGNAALRELYASNNPVREIDLSIHENVEIVELQDMPVLELINLKTAIAATGQNIISYRAIRRSKSNRRPRIRTGIRERPLQRQTRSKRRDGITRCSFKHGRRGEDCSSRLL